MHCRVSYHNIILYTALIRLVDCYVIGCVGSNIHADSSVCALYNQYVLDKEVS